MTKAGLNDPLKRRPLDGKDKGVYGLRIEGKEIMMMETSTVAPYNGAFQKIDQTQEL